MKIQLNEITIREVVDQYINHQENGVKGYHGLLDIRPAYQREFIYKDAKRDAVIHTVNKGFPLNVMYWVRNSNNTYEVLDGQQRTISICEYVAGNFSVDFRYFFNLSDIEKNKILDYKLMIYICEGDETEKLNWFRTINIANEQLTDQELRNAIYVGPWLTHAKTIFSKNNCPANNLGKDYLTGNPIRQDYLETALKWITDGNIEDYMSKHQKDPNANDLWLYFQNVLSWVRLNFKIYRKEMKGINWGGLYNNYHQKLLDTNLLEQRIYDLMSDDDVTNKKGVYTFVLTNQERSLSIRAFTDSQKRSVYERQQGICSHCKQHFNIEDMEADHITPWSIGGHTTVENCQMLCKECNRNKSNI